MNYNNYSIYTIKNPKSIRFLFGMTKGTKTKLLQVIQNEQYKSRVSYFQIIGYRTVFEVVHDKTYKDLKGIYNKQIEQLVTDYNAEAESVYSGINCLTYEEVFDMFRESLNDIVLNNVRKSIKKLHTEIKDTVWAEKKISNISKVVVYSNFMGLVIGSLNHIMPLIIDFAGNLYRGTTYKTISEQCLYECNNFLKSIDYPAFLTKENWKTLPTK